MYDIISAFQCYTISVDVYFPFHCTLWMACLTFLLILCYCCCAHDNDVSHTLHREWGVTAAAQTQRQIHGVAPGDVAEDTASGAVSAVAVVAVVGDDLHPHTDWVLLTSSDNVRHSPWCHTTFALTCIHDSLYMLLR